MQRHSICNVSKMSLLKGAMWWVSDRTRAKVYAFWGSECIWEMSSDREIPFVGIWVIEYWELSVSNSFVIRTLPMIRYDFWTAMLTRLSRVTLIGNSGAKLDLRSWRTDRSLSWSFNGRFLSELSEVLHQPTSPMAGAKTRYIHSCWSNFWSRTHVIKLVSSANTGYFYTMVRPRTAVPKRMMKFDPRGSPIPRHHR